MDLASLFRQYCRNTCATSSQHFVLRSFGVMLILFFLMVSIVNSAFLRSQSYDTCSFSCFGVSQVNANVCSGRGQCTFSDTCNCDDGYEGLNCQFYSSNRPLNTSRPNFSSWLSGLKTMYLLDWKNQELMNTEINKQLPSPTLPIQMQDWTCFGLHRLDPKVCGSSGVCLSQDYCLCEKENLYGNCTFESKPSLNCDFVEGGEVPECGYNTNPLTELNTREIFSDSLEDATVCNVEQYLFDVRCQFTFYLQELDFEKAGNMEFEGYSFTGFTYNDLNEVRSKHFRCVSCKIGVGSVFKRGSLIFDGSSYGQITDSNVFKGLVNNFSFQFWFISYTSANYGKTLFDFVSYSNWKIFFNDKKQISIQYSGGSLYTNRNITDNKVYNVYISKSSTSGLFIYINGELVYSGGSLVNDWKFDYYTGIRDTLGCDRDGTNNFIGEIELFEITPRPTSIQEIKQQDEKRTWSCFSVDKSNETVCSGNGFCEQTTICNCSDGFFGLNCELSNNTNITITTNPTNNTKINVTTPLDRYEKTYIFNYNYTVPIVPNEDYKIILKNQKVYMNKTISCLNFQNISTEVIEITNLLIKNSFIFGKDVSISKIGNEIYIWIDLTQTYHNNFVFPSLFWYNRISGEIKSLILPGEYPNSVSPVSHNEFVSLTIEHPQQTILKVIFHSINGGQALLKDSRIIPLNQSLVLKVIETLTKDDNIEFLIAVIEDSSSFRFISLQVRMGAGDITLKWFSFPKGGFSVLQESPEDGGKIFVKIENDTRLYLIPENGTEPTLIYINSYPSMNENPSTIYITENLVFIGLARVPYSTVEIDLKNNPPTTSVIISNSPLFPKINPLSEVMGGSGGNSGGGIVGGGPSQEENVTNIDVHICSSAPSNKL